MQVSFGPISWLIVGEVFPLAVRGQAGALATVTNFGSNFLVCVAKPVHPALPCNHEPVCCLIYYPAYFTPSIQTSPDALLVTGDHWLSLCEPHTSGSLQCR